MGIQYLNKLKYLYHMKETILSKYIIIIIYYLNYPIQQKLEEFRNLRERN